MNEDAMMLQQWEDDGGAIHPPVEKPNPLAAGISDIYEMGLREESEVVA